MKRNARIQAECRSCYRRTTHVIVRSHSVNSDPNEYHENNQYEIVRCLGCNTYGFRHVNNDYEQLDEEEPGVYSHQVSVQLYPAVFAGHRPLTETYLLPGLLNLVYRETLGALNQRAFVLASVGLRACIEAVCNHLDISGSSLEKRIDQLFKAGYVSNRDKKRLHAIRFLGNDAAHEVKKPAEPDIRIALEIVEHLLNSVFILESKAKALETIAESYEDFLSLLGTLASGFAGTGAISLAGLLIDKRRLVGPRLEEFESQLVKNIQAGEVPYLALAEEREVGGRMVQFYEIDASKAPSVEDDLPF